MKKKFAIALMVIGLMIFFAGLFSHKEVTFDGTEIVTVSVGSAVGAGVGALIGGAGTILCGTIICPPFGGLMLALGLVGGLIGKAVGRPTTTQIVPCTNLPLLILGLVLLGIGFFMQQQKQTGYEQKISEVAETSSDKKNSSES